MNGRDSLFKFRRKRRFTVQITSPSGAVGWQFKTKARSADEARRAAIYHEFKAGRPDYMTYEYEVVGS